MEEQRDTVEYDITIRVEASDTTDARNLVDDLRRGQVRRLDRYPYNIVGFVRAPLSGR